MPDTQVVIEKLADRMELAENGCWLWTMGINGRGGHGRIRIETQRYLAHRLAYETVVGPVPDGLVLDHLCREPRCLNPDHLEPVTHAENIRRGTVGEHNRSKTHCTHGHPFDDTNTYLYKGGRYCRTCRNAQSAAYLERRKVA